jgi:polyhydroxyalkanoate synthesis regulator protein
MLRNIKRYKNRKLYDIASSSYVNFEELRDSIRSGDEIVVLDRESGFDVTLYVLASMLSQEEFDSPSKSDSAYEKLIEVVRLHREVQAPPEEHSKSDQ